jgi:4-amino-4-deoxy-L-arabinose transferase-like glycosyltransferase
MSKGTKNLLLCRLTNSHLYGGISVTALALLVFLFASAFFLFDIGDNSIRYSDEATHVRVIQEMYASGDYLSPTLDGALYLNKPPLKMWLTLGIIKIIGESNFSFRLIDGLCSAGIVALTFLFGCSLFTSRLAGLLASLILIGSAGFFYGGRFNSATQDAFVVFTNTSALWCAYLGLTRVRQGVNKSLLLPFIGFGLAIAAGVLTKSVVGLVPLVVLAPALLFNFDLIKILFRRHLGTLALGILIAILPVAIYFGQVFLRFDDAWSRIFGYDIKARLFTEGFHNPEKWWFYLDRLFVQSEFCAAWLLSLGLLFQIYKVIKFPKFEQIFLTSWTFLPLLIFTCLQSRAFHYIGPAFPAFALVITGFVFACIDCIRQKRGALKYLCLGILVISLFTICAAGVGAISRLLRSKHQLPIELAVNDLLKLPRSLKVATFNFTEFLGGDTYQRWRAQFYLDSLNRERQNFSSLEELKQTLQGLAVDVVFTSWESGLQLISENSGKDSICGYWPLWRPEKKRQSVKPNPGVPEAVAILFSNCKEAAKFNSIHLLKQSFQFESEQVQTLYGIGGRQKVGSQNFWQMPGASAAILLPRDDVLVELPSKLIFSAGLQSVGGKYGVSEIAVVLNGTSLGPLKISGGKFRSYSLDIPKKVWSRAGNLLSWHDLKVRESNLGSALMISSIKVELGH